MGCKKVENLNTYDESEIKRLRDDVVFVTEYFDCDKAYVMKSIESKVGELSKLYPNHPEIIEMEERISEWWHTIKYADWSYNVSDLLGFV